MSIKQRSDRYKHEKENVIVEVGVKNSRQRFNERDPAPFRHRDLDPQFVVYLASAVEEFPLRTKIKTRVLTCDVEDLRPENVLATRDALGAYFQYESTLAKANLRKKHRTARCFSLISLVTRIVCLTIAQFIESIKLVPISVGDIASVSFVIIGGVAMWHPIEALLYGWWPIREQRQYFDNIAALSVEIVSAHQSTGESHVIRTTADA